MDVLNATGRPGLAAQLQNTLSTRGYTAGTVGNDDRRLTHTIVDYPPGESATAAQLTAALGSATARQDPALPGGHLRVNIGTDLTAATIAALGNASIGPSRAAPTSSAAAAGADANALSMLSTGGVPCVK